MRCVGGEVVDHGLFPCSDTSAPPLVATRDACDGPLQASSRPTLRVLCGGIASADFFQKSL